MKITKESVKAWKAEYEKINAAEREELKTRLATETIEQSIRSYFTWVKMVTAMAGSTDVPLELQESHEEESLELFNKWRVLAERIKNV
jgi:hypothetical protein